MHKCIYLCTRNAQAHESPTDKGVGGFRQAKKNPLSGGLYLTAVRLTGVHAPPEDVTEDADLLFLDLLEAVVLIRMFIAVEAAQADPCR